MTARLRESRARSLAQQFVQKFDVTCIAALVDLESRQELSAIMKELGMSSVETNLVQRALTAKIIKTVDSTLYLSPLSLSASQGRDPNDGGPPFPSPDVTNDSTADTADTASTSFNALHGDGQPSPRDADKRESDIANDLKAQSDSLSYCASGAGRAMPLDPVRVREGLTQGHPLHGLFETLAAQPVQSLSLRTVLQPVFDVLAPTVPHSTYVKSSRPSPASEGGEKLGGGQRGRGGDKPDSVHEARNCGGSGVGLDDRVREAVKRVLSAGGSLSPRVSVSHTPQSPTSPSYSCTSSSSSSSPRNVAAVDVSIVDGLRVNLDVALDAARHKLTELTHTATSSTIHTSATTLSTDPCTSKSATSEGSMGQRKRELSEADKCLLCMSIDELAVIILYTMEGVTREQSFYAILNQVRACSSSLSYSCNVNEVRGKLLCRPKLPHCNRD